MTTSKAFKKFSKTHVRALSQLAGSLILYRGVVVRARETAETVGEYSDYPELTDMARSGIVIAVGAMDAYYTQRFCESLVPYLKAGKLNKRLTSLLEKAGLDIPTSLRLLAMDRPYRRIRALLDNHVQSKVTQRFAAIDDLYQCYEVKSLTQLAQAEASRTKLLASVKTLVARRHKIVHAGDVNSHGRLRPIVEKEVRRRLQDVAVLVKASDAVLGREVGR